MASSDTTDISKILIALGVKEDLAKNIKNRMNGVDYLNLVNSIDDDTPNGREQAETILSKYGINIRKDPKMDTTRLESIYAGVRAGKQFDEAEQMQHVRPISEMDSLGAKMSGYSNFVRAANDTDAEALRDWLEENEFDYQNNDKLTFLVQSADREKAYRLNHFMGKMNGKTSVMDDSSVVEEKKNMAKDLPKSRNPIAAGIVKKSGGGAHNSKDPARKDAWSRSAKHKGKNYESIEESVFAQGESVTFEGNECPVHIPAGPNGTVGILVDGKVRMVRESDITRIDEGVLGMTKVDPLYRLRELAGVKASVSPVVEDDFGSVDPMDMDVADDFSDDSFEIDAGSDASDISDIDGDVDSAELGGMGTSDLDGTADEIGSFDGDIGGDGLGGSGLDMASGDDAAFGAMDAGVPGDLPPGGVGGVTTITPPDSEAYTLIQDHLNNIQQSLGDVKLSEYRSLIAKLEALAVQVKSMGRDYLGEQRKLKR